MQGLRRLTFFEGALCLLIKFGQASSSIAVSSTVTTSTISETDSGFIGYYVAPETTAAYFLASDAEWVTSGTYAAKCEPTDAVCAFPTLCGNNILSYDDGSTTSCGASSSCVTMYIFQTSPYGSPSATDVYCRANWTAFTFYRELEILSTIYFTGSSTSAPTPTASSTTISSGPTAATSVAIATATATAIASSPSGSLAWVAGAVIGPIAAIGLIILAFFFGRKYQGGRSSAKPTGTNHAIDENGQQISELEGSQRSPEPHHVSFSSSQGIGLYAREGNVRPMSELPNN